MTAMVKLLTILETGAKTLEGIRTVLYRIDVTLDQIDSKLPNDAMELAAELAETTEDYHDVVNERNLLAKVLDELILSDILAEDWVEKLKNDFREEVSCTPPSPSATSPQPAS